MKHLLLILGICIIIAGCDLSGNLQSADEEVILSNNYVLLATNEGISKSIGGTPFYETIDSNNSLNGGNVYTLFNLENRLFAGTANGLYISDDDGSNWISKGVLDGIDQVACQAIGYVNGSAEELVLIGTESNGMYISSNGGDNYVNVTVADNGISSDNVTAFAVDPLAGSIFVGFDTGLYVTYTGADILDGNMGYDPIVLNLGDAASNTINSILYAGGENMDVYVSTDNGLFLVQWETIQAGNYLENESVQGFAINSQGVWFAATGSRIQISEDNGASFITKNWTDGLSNGLINDITIDSNDTIFISTIDGVSISSDDGVTFTTYKSADGLANSSVSEVIVVE